jgi:hypothetical protein
VLPQSKKAADFFALVLAGSFFADRRVFRSFFAGRQLFRRSAGFSPTGEFRRSASSSAARRLRIQRRRKYMRGFNAASDDRPNKLTL